MDWIVVVPSYNRPGAIKEKTLAVLDFHKIPHNKIYVFVANEDQKKQYLESIGDTYNIVVGVKGLAQIRNFIFNYFPIGTKLVSFDDDVKKFVKLADGKLIDFEESELVQLINTGFEECEKSGAKLWGTYPVSTNAYFMKNTITHDFKFIVGSFWGCINPGAEIQITSGDEKEDYMRTILFWIRDKKIVRINYVAHRTSCYFGAGGLQSDGTDARIAKQKAIVEKLLELYPQYIRINTRRKSIYPEILLRRQKK